MCHSCIINKINILHERCLRIICGNKQSSFEELIEKDSSVLSNPMAISNIFKKYFSSVANKTKFNISFSSKHFSDFLKNISNICFFVSPTHKTGIENVKSSLDCNKSVGPNSILNKVLKLLKYDISSQLPKIFNTSFFYGVFHSIIKTAKVIPVHKKDSRLDFSNYHLIA